MKREIVLEATKGLWHDVLDFGKESL